MIPLTLRMRGPMDYLFISRVFGVFRGLPSSHLGLQVLRMESCFNTRGSRVQHRCCRFFRLSSLSNP